MKFTPGTHPEEYSTFVNGLRQKQPKAKSSTYKKDSPNAILGEASEIVLTERVRKVLNNKGLNWTVERKSDLDFEDPFNVISNAYEGDVHVYDQHLDRRVSFEVKASLEWPNATISGSELENSEAEYFVGVTTAGLWICTMKEARLRAYQKSGFYGSFYVVPYDTTRKVSLEDIFPEV